MSFLRQIVPWVDRVIDGMAWIAGLLLLFMMFSICYEVILRYFLFRPPAWVTEISEYILLYTTFLGASWLLKREGHVKVDVILSRLGSRGQKIFNMITSMLGVIICCILVWFGAEMTWDYYCQGIPVIKSLSVPKFLLLGIIPIGSFFLVIQFIRQVHGFWMGLKAEEMAKREIEKIEKGL